MSNPKTDVLIIGAGPSGTVSASILKKYGYSVTIIEKQEFPRFVIGESLLPRCMDNLEKAGFIEAIKKAGFQKKLGAKFLRENESSVFDFSTQYTKGWTWTWQVKRDRFDNLLAEEVQKAGVKIIFKAAVTDVKFINEEKMITRILHDHGEEETFESRFVIDASGYGRVLPRMFNLQTPSNFPSRTALFSHVDNLQFGDDKEKNQILILSNNEDIWGWVIPFSDGSASVGIVGEENNVMRVANDSDESYKYWLENLSPLRERARECKLKFPPRKIGGYSASVTKKFGPGFAIAGNSAEFTDPIFSSGTTFATESGVLVAELIHRKFSGEIIDWQTEYSEYLDRGNNVFKTFIENWYSGVLQRIIYSKKHNDTIREQICSVLAGYVWDETNPIVKKHDRSIPALAYILADE